MLLPEEAAEFQDKYDHDRHDDHGCRNTQAGQDLFQPGRFVVLFALFLVFLCALRLLITFFQITPFPALTDLLHRL